MRLPNPAAQVGEPVIRGFSPGPVVLGNATGLRTDHPRCRKTLLSIPRTFRKVAVCKHSAERPEGGDSNVIAVQMSITLRAVSIEYMKAD